MKRGFVHSYSTSAGQFQTRQVMVGTHGEIRGIIGSLGQMRELQG